VPVSECAHPESPADDPDARHAASRFRHFRPCRRGIDDKCQAPQPHRYGRSWPACCGPVARLANVAASRRDVYASFDGVGQAGVAFCVSSGTRQRSSVVKLLNPRDRDRSRLDQLLAQRHNVTL
jgi:hypothetical protein